jgi:hypothetical protein
MRYFIFLFLLIQSVVGVCQNTTTRKDFAIIDLSQKQILLFNKYRNDSLTRRSVFGDSLYKPYKSFWSGYIGTEGDFLEWVESKVLPQMDAYNKRNKQINGAKLLRQFDEVKTRMKKITGYRPVGTWYIIYGPAWTDLGALTGGTMLIDLSHEKNSSNENIMMMFPHEITHQIHANVSRHSDTSAIGSIIGEGFAVYMNKLYWKDKFSLASNLGFSETELQECKRQEAVIKAFFQKNKFSTGKEEINRFRNRSYQLNSKLPGAIGYYIGYRIVEKYVGKYGQDSWKDVFRKSPREIYELSGY